MGYHETAAFNVLLVDDSVDYLDLFTIYAKKSGFNLMTAATGEAALDILKNESLDCIILDYMLPDLTGAEIFARLQSDRSMRHNRKVPVIVLSAVTIPERKVEELYKQGISLFLTKSFGLKELAVIIENLSYAAKIRAKSEKNRKGSRSKPCSLNH